METIRPPGLEHVRDQRIERTVPLVTPARPARAAAAERRAGRAGACAAARDVAAVLDGDDDRLLVVVGPCSVHDVEAALDYASRLSAQAAGARGRPADRDARVLREAAHHDRLEGPDQRPPPGRLRRRGHRAAPGPRAAAGGAVARLAVGCEFLDPITPAVHLRHRGVGSDRRPHHREPDPPPAGLRAVDAGRASRTAPTATCRWRSTPAARLAPRTRSRAWRSVAPRRSCTPPATPTAHVILRGGRDAPNYTPPAVADALDRLRAAGLPERVVIDASHDNSAKDPARQPLAAADDRRAGGGRQARDRRGDAGVLPRRRAPGSLGAGEGWCTASRSPTPAWTGSTTVSCSTRWRRRAPARDTAAQSV